MATATPYPFLDEFFDRHAGSNIGFDALVAAAPLVLAKSEREGFEKRHRLITRFQDIVLDLFRQSLAGEAPPGIAESILSDVTPGLGLDYHRALPASTFRRPLFFRTDELVPGTLSEIQCPGSGWANLDVLEAFYRRHPEAAGEAGAPRSTLSSRIADVTRRVIDEDPRIFYLLDNSSQPHGARYFLQRTRAAGLRYYAWDAGLHPNECNLVRAHDWISPVTGNFHDRHLQACAEGTLRYDLSPIAVFDCKLIYALPFDPDTRHLFPDELRGLFPATQRLGGGTLCTRTGEPVSDEQFCDTASIRRHFYLKYAGTDVNRNWGSRTVFSLKNASRQQARKLLEAARGDEARGYPWILQESHRHPEDVTFIRQDGDHETIASYRKSSAFYGPGGLLGVMAYYLHAPKVHGSKQTVMRAAF